MLQPTKTARSGFLHTHLVRARSLMLQPTKTVCLPEIPRASASVRFHVVASHWI